jgi:hypothetical protein
MHGPPIGQRLEKRHEMVRARRKAYDPVTVLSRCVGGMANGGRNGAGERSGERFRLDFGTEADVDLETTDAQYCAVGARRDGFGERVRQMPLSSLDQAGLQIGRRRVIAGGETP